MRQALGQLAVRPDAVVVDAVTLQDLELPGPSHPVPPCLALVKADAWSYAVACASIVAKEARDRMLLELDREYPLYGFARHKGYGAPDHLAGPGALRPQSAPPSDLPLRSSAAREKGRLMAIDRPQVIASAEKLVSRGKIEAAIKEYRKLLAENPNDASTLNRLGDLYARIDRIDEAVRLFSQIADRYTDDGFFVKAIAIFKKIIKLDPTRLAVYERLAELYHKQGLIPEARTQYQVLVDYYQKHDSPSSAIGVLQKMAILIPDDPAPHVKLAELFHSQKLTEKALAEYRLIADLMLRHNKVEEATQVYAKAIEAEPGDIAFITDAVLGLKDAGHVGAAARLLALAVERNPQAEKIARIAGLHRAAHRPPQPSDDARPSGASLKVSDVTRSGSESHDVLQLDSNLLEASAFPEVLEHPVAPPVEPVRPPPPSPGLSRCPRRRYSGRSTRARSISSSSSRTISDLPSTQVSPTDDMLRRSPDSPWFEAGEEVEVEFDLDLDGLRAIARDPGPPVRPRDPLERPPPPPPGRDVVAAVRSDARAGTRRSPVPRCRRSSRRRSRGGLRDRLELRARAGARDSGRRRSLPPTRPS